MALNFAYGPLMESSQLAPSSPNSDFQAENDVDHDAPKNSRTHLTSRTCPGSFGSAQVITWERFDRQVLAMIGFFAPPGNASNV